MLIFIAAKHASHALPVKALTRLLPQVERRYAQQEWSTTKCQKNPPKYRWPANHGEGRAVQYSVRKTTHSCQGFTVIQCCTCFDHRHTHKIAPSTKPIHLGNNNSKNKDGNIKNDTHRILAHAEFFILCHTWNAIWTEARERPESNMTCHWQGLALCCFPNA